MITISCWLWNDGGSREFLPKHVNRLYEMVKRNITIPFRFVCITDEKGDFADGVEVMPEPAACKPLAALRSPEGARFPSCYRRLWMFSEEAKCLGEKVLQIDIDVIIVDDITPIVDRDVDFMGWRPYRDWGAKTRFGGGLYLMKPGTRTQVYNDFHGLPSIAKARAAGYRGSDQAWLSYKLGPHDPYFERTSGIYSIRDMVNFNPSDRYRLPEDARIVQLNGPQKPWSPELKHVPWIASFGQIKGPLAPPITAYKIPTESKTKPPPPAKPVPPKGRIKRRRGAG